MLFWALTVLTDDRQPLVGIWKLLTYDVEF
jgi:hypothetical protein